MFLALRLLPCALPSVISVRDNDVYPLRFSDNSSDNRVRAISLAMGLTPIIWTATPTGQKFDTNGTSLRLIYDSSVLIST